jgi:hypothetical protein
MLDNDFPNDGRVVYINNNASSKAGDKMECAIEDGRPWVKGEDLPEKVL